MVSSAWFDGGMMKNKARGFIGVFANRQTLIALLVLIGIVGWQSYQGRRMERLRQFVFEDTHRRWREGDPKTPAPELRLVVLTELNETELKKLFPKGRAHLPAVFEQFGIYREFPDGSGRQWEYVGSREVEGYRFYLFREVNFWSVERIGFMRATPILDGSHAGDAES